MKTLIKNTLAALAITVAAGMAHANSNPAWLCNLNFSGKSKSVQVIVGHSEFSGKGTVRCISNDREELVMPIKVTMTSKPIAPRIGLGKMELYGEALQLTLTNSDPTSLLGSYLVAEGRAAVVGGVGVIAAVRAKDDNFSLNISLQVVKGFGVDLGFRKMKIELDTEAVESLN